MNSRDHADSSHCFHRFEYLILMRFHGVVDRLSDQCHNRVPKMIHEVDGQGVDVLRRNRASP